MIHEHKNILVFIVEYVYICVYMHMLMNTQLFGIFNTTLAHRSYLCIFCKVSYNSNATHLMSLR